MNKIQQKTVKTATKLGVLSCVSITAIMASANAAQAWETFRINGSNYAMNTNQNFSKIDGYPRMSLYSHNLGDKDQQFGRILVSGNTYLLQHRSISETYGRPMCLNAHRPEDGGAVNVWDCNKSDPDQQFNLKPLGSDIWHIERKYPDSKGRYYCIDNPNRTNGGTVYLWTCNSNNVNQRWRSSKKIIQSTSSLTRGQEWKTNNGYKWVFQTDGNLVYYSPSNRVLWAAGSERMNANRFTFQNDGNAVLYDIANKPIFATNTPGNSGAYFAIQEDGNIVIYTADNRVLWATNTVGENSSGITNAASRWLASLPSTPSLPSTLESSLKSFFSNTANTNGEIWSNTSITQMWDRVIGESAQFPGGNFTNGDRWQVDMPTDIYNLYKELSTKTLGSVRPINSGYAYDQSYFNSYAKWHSALDIDAANGTSVKAIIGGTAWVIQNINGNYFLAIKADDGKLWIYGHLATRNFSNGQRINTGQIIGLVGSGHLHLEVQNNHNYAQTNGAHSDRNFILNNTISPLEAYRNLKK